MPNSPLSGRAVAEKPPLTILLAAPRGFCAGVDRAIQIVERALETYGAPVYVRHEIVHNRYVVNRLREKGAVFVEELDEIPETSAPVIFSAHGVARDVHAAAKDRKLFTLDATCPLVTKVHMEARQHHDLGRTFLLPNSLLRNVFPPAPATDSAASNRRWSANIQLAPFIASSSADGRPPRTP